jgi:RNA-directed DNA polymerase
MMGEREKSDPTVVAVKPAKFTAQAVGELVEPRVGTEGNAGQDGTHRTPSRASVFPGLLRIRQAARERRKEKFTALLHHVDVALLGWSYGQLRKEAAAGVDGLTWDDYGEGLQARLVDLHARVHLGSYRAQPSRRQYIPKPDGRRRPLGIAAVEDKIVQRAVVEVLNAIYEEDFLGFSYGFRPGRSQHQALDALAVGIERTAVNWIVDADITAFFDTMNHEWLIRFVEHRIGDARIVRLIRKWLKTGVMEDGEVKAGSVGTPQGAVISPLLANIYLHYVFDLWVDQWRGSQAQGNIIIVRYADDIVVGTKHRADAERLMAAMRDRLGKFGLTLHPEKTRLIEFGRFVAANREKRGVGKPDSFNFLGFTHICARNRNGRFFVKRKSRRDRARAKLREVKEELMRRRHEPTDEVGRWLQRVVTGWFNYHAVPYNRGALEAFRFHILEGWRRALRRRGQRDRTTWARITALARRWLPQPRILHPWPFKRFAVIHPRWEPGASIGHAGFCAGGAR